MGWSRPHPAASTQAKAVTSVPATPSKAASKTSRVMQQHWVPFEGLTADSARPVQLLDLVFLAGPGSRYVRLQLYAPASTNSWAFTPRAAGLANRDFKGRPLLAVLYSCPPRNPETLSSVHLRVVAVPVHATAKEAPVERGPWYVRHRRPAPQLTLHTC